MSYRFRRTETPVRALRRVAGEEFSQAMETLRQESRPAVRIHTARRHLKRLRALLGLLRAGGQREFFRSRRRRLRQLGRRLAPARDHQVVLAALSGFQRRARENTARRAAGKLRRRLIARWQPSPARVPVPGVLRALAGLELEVQAWPGRNLSWAAFVAALARSYRAARTDQEHHRLHPGPVALHQWRKRAKRLWYQLVLLQCLRRRSLDRLVSQLETLTELQGLSHDLHLVECVLCRHAAALSAMERESLVEILAEEQAGLSRRITVLGDAAFKRKPAAFRRKLRPGPR